MATRRKRKAKATPTSGSSGPLSDFGPPELAQHADWVMPAGVRRRQRHPIHDWLFGRGAISAAEWQAADDYARDYALALGARAGGPALDRVDGGGGVEPAEGMLAAIGRRRRVMGRLGRASVRLLDVALGECLSRRRLALQFVGRDDGGAYGEVERAVKGCLARLAGRMR